MLTTARKGTSYLSYSSDYAISYFPRTAVQLYYRCRRLQPAVYTPVLLHQPYWYSCTAYEE